LHLGVQENKGGALRSKLVNEYEGKLLDSSKLTKTSISARKISLAERSFVIVV